MNSDPEVHEIAYQYGRNVGIAFQVRHALSLPPDFPFRMTSGFFFSSVVQLVDDVLDFTSGASQLGKPSAADLKLGLATGPVLFACQQARTYKLFAFQ